MHIPKTTNRLFAITILALLVCSACSPQQDSVPPTGTLSDAMPDAEVSTEVDALGRTLVFPETPQRIVVAGKSSLTVIEALYLFPEAADRVVALVVGRQNPGDFLGLVDPTFGDKVSLEIEAGPEQIAPLAPDIVIMRSFMEPKLGRSLEELDIRVAFTDLETPEQYTRDLVTLGRVLDSPERAAEIGQYYQDRTLFVQQVLSQVAGDQEPTVLLMQYSAKGGAVALSVPAASWMQTAMVELAGGIPVWRDAAQGGGWTIVNLEQIAAWDPDVILLADYGGDPDQAVSNLGADPQWQGLRAVRDGRFHAFPADFYSWDQPDPRWILGLTWLAQRLHPSLFAELEMEQIVFDFFERMYRLDRATIETNILSQVRDALQ